jgi:hypothetical protein
MGATLGPNRARTVQTAKRPPVRLVDERRFEPPRPVEVLGADGSWWPGMQRAWRLCDDDRGWVADVEYVARHEWGSGKHLASVPPERVRLVADPENCQR